MEAKDNRRIVLLHDCLSHAYVDHDAASNIGVVALLLAVGRQISMYRSS